MSRTEITEQERAVMLDCRRDYTLPTDEDAAKICAVLARRGLMLTKPQPYVSTCDAAVGMQFKMSFKVSPAGLRVLNGQAAHPQTPAQARDRKWRAETKQLIKAGKPCDFVGCRKQGVHGHHKKKRRSRDFSAKNRVMLCEEHHAWVENNHYEAIELGYSVSIHDPIQPAADRAPSQRSVS